MTWVLWQHPWQTFNMFFFSVASSLFFWNSLEIGFRQRKLLGEVDVIWMGSFSSPHWSWMKPTINQKMGLSENSGTPKSSISIWFSIINHPFWGIPIFGNTQMAIKFPPCLLKNASEKRRSRRWGACCCLQGGEKWWGDPVLSPVFDIGSNTRTQNWTWFTWKWGPKRKFGEKWHPNGIGDSEFGNHHF